MTNIDHGQLAPSHLAAPRPQPYPAAAAYPQQFPTAPYPPVAAPPAVVDPGRTLGIVGLVLACCAGALGLIVSIVAHARSRRAGFRNGPALAGIVVGSIATVALLASGVFAGVAAKSVLDTCRDLGPGEHSVNGVTYTCG